MPQSVRFYLINLIYLWNLFYKFFNIYLKNDLFASNIEITLKYIAVFDWSVLSKEADQPGFVRSLL